MKHLFLVFFITQCIWTQEPSVFDFSKSLRIDFNLLTDAQRTGVLFRQLKREPYWGGPTHQLITPNWGSFRLLILDGSKIVFSKGFDSLSNEWAAIDEAKNEKRLFYHTIQIPLPKKTLRVQINQRDREGTFHPLSSCEIRPNDYFIKVGIPISCPSKDLLIDGSPSEKVDLIILAEGYTAAETDKFYADAQRMTDYMFTIPPFDKLKKDFNVRAIAVPPAESGTDIPGKNTYRNTAFNSSSYTFNQERYLTTNSLKEIADVAAAVPYDQLYVLVSTPIYSGGGFYNHPNLGTADNEFSEEVYIHEFGHDFVGLADEYYYDWDPTFQDMYNQRIEPWEENITTLVDFGSKWEDMVQKNTPIPTPRIKKYQKVVGAFEGGGYTNKGVYNPMQDCRMKSNEPKGLCPVCEGAMQKIVNFYTK